MRRNIIKTCIILSVVLLFAQSWAVCPEEPNDGGNCDTLYVNIHPPDQEPDSAPPYLVRFPIRITNDIPDPTVDSIAGLVIPLCYSHSNPSAYCRVTNSWNNALYEWGTPPSIMARSIFRDLDGEVNLIHSLYGTYPSMIPLMTVFLDLDGTSHFWLGLVPNSSKSQRLPGGSRMLIATMTFEMEDTATVCIDSCFWPPSDHLAFSNSEAELYIPRHNLPICEFVGEQPHVPYYTQYPADVSHNKNGIFNSAPFEVTDAVDEVLAVTAEFEGSGVAENVIVYYYATVNPVSGFVKYTVVDHCQSGGIITLTARDENGYLGHCSFEVDLGNDAPALSLPDPFFAIRGGTCCLMAPATDANDDEVEVSFNGLWYEPDSLQLPVNPPLYTPGNPGYLQWSPAETEEGTWMCSFTATDECGGEDTELMTILVGSLFCGDSNGDASIDISDGIILLGFLYKNGTAPEPLCKGDANGDGQVDVGDAVYLLNYLFKNGPAPCFDCCEGGY